MLTTPVTSGEFTATFTLYPGVPSGRYNVTSIQLQHNDTTTTVIGESTILANPSWTSFYTVEGPTDNTPPTISNFQIVNSV